VLVVEEDKLTMLGSLTPIERTPLVCFDIKIIIKDYLSPVIGRRQQTAAQDRDNSEERELQAALRSSLNDQERRDDPELQSAIERSLADEPRQPPFNPHDPTAPPLEHVQPSVNPNDPSAPPLEHLQSSYNPRDPSAPPIEHLQGPRLRQGGMDAVRAARLRRFQNHT